MQISNLKVFKIQINNPHIIPSSSMSTNFDVNEVEIESAVPWKMSMIGTTYNKY